ncbi:type II toxin-antitoxin system RelE/ParE family toxin [Glaesserella parasuis]|nr:type II toxin-antitoxin system RelE/ParE family toxin [Glaesserella parasuis]
MLSFERLFATKQHIADTQLLEAIQRAKNGLIDAHLGGNIINNVLPTKAKYESA